MQVGKFPPISSCSPIGSPQRQLKRRRAGRFEDLRMAFGYRQMECCHHRDWDQEGGRLIGWYLRLANSPRMRAHPKVGCKHPPFEEKRNSGVRGGEQILFALSALMRLS